MISSAKYYYEGAEKNLQISISPFFLLILRETFSDDPELLQTVYSANNHYGKPYFYTSHCRLIVAELYGAYR